MGDKEFSRFFVYLLGKEYDTVLLKDVNSGLSTILEQQFHPLKYTMFPLDGNNDSIINCKDAVIEYR